MLSKCANPGCPAPFRYLHQGKLFRLDTGPEYPPAKSSEKPVRRLEFFWLCEECAVRLTLDYKQGVGITMISLNEEQRRAASAP